MNRPEDSNIPPRTRQDGATSGSRGKATSTSGPQKTYLIAYNLISTLLWAVVLGRVVAVTVSQGHGRVFDSTFDYVKIVQSLAVLEVLHSAIGTRMSTPGRSCPAGAWHWKRDQLADDPGSLTGIVRAPLLTTVMQVSSRLVLVWGIANLFPQVTAASPAYTSMLLAWSATEVVRYSFFAINLATGAVPRWLTWLRYNTFFVLYPLGIGSECWLVWRAVEPSKDFGLGLEWVLTAVLLIYIPGEWCLLLFSTSLPAH